MIVQDLSTTLLSKKNLTLKGDVLKMALGDDEFYASENLEDKVDDYEEDDEGENRLAIPIEDEDEIQELNFGD